MHFFCNHKNNFIMSQDLKQDSVLAGWTEDPAYKEDGTVKSWKVSFKEHELKEILDKYVSATNAEGHGGKVYMTLFQSNKGGFHCRIYDPYSEGAKQWADKKANDQAASSNGDDDLPF
jgi:hypothetical protein